MDTCESGGGFRNAELASRLADRFGLSEEERRRLQKGGRTFLTNRTAWAVWALKKAGFVRVEASVITITDSGTEALRRSMSSKDIWKIAMGRIKKPKPDEGETPTDLGGPPEEEIRKAHDRIRQKAEAELLSGIRKTSPASFDRIVVQLVRKMGYEIGDRAPARPGDGMAATALKTDKLGSDEIHLRAKQQSAAVSLDQVRNFTETLAGTKSRRGALITTSDFSSDARRHVESIADADITLIDGKMLAHYMYDHDLGVIHDATYSVKIVDEGFFQDG